MGASIHSQPEALLSLGGFIYSKIIQNGYRKWVVTTKLCEVKKMSPIRSDLSCKRTLQLIRTAKHPHTATESVLRPHASAQGSSVPDRREKCSARRKTAPYCGALDQQNRFLWWDSLCLRSCDDFKILMLCSVLGEKLLLSTLLA